MLYHKKDGTHISKEELEEKLKSIFKEENWNIQLASSLTKMLKEIPIQKKGVHNNACTF